MNHHNNCGPEHVGIIADGMRRWSKENNLPLTDSYDTARGILLDVIEYLFERNVSIISSYVLSKDNLKRSPEYLIPAFNILEKLLINLSDDLSSVYKAKVVLAGELSNLPPNIQYLFKDLFDKSSHYHDRKLYLLTGYHPFDEIRHSSFVDQPFSIESLWVKEPVDLVFRTSGVNRISNFLPLQCGYAEITFLNKLWNDITIQDVENVLVDYRLRQKRFGI